MLKDFLGPPIWRPVNSVNIWNLLSLCIRLIVAILALCHASPRFRNSKCAGIQTKDAIKLESCKHLVPLMRDEDKTYTGSVFSFRFEHLMTSRAHSL